MSLADALITYARTGGKSVGGILEALAASRKERYPRYSAQSRPTPQGDGEGGGQSGPSYPVQHAGDMLILPTTWKGTHVTSGLGWNARSASDIMGSPGTPVGAPEPGVVQYWHPTGAQGGGSMLIKTYTGHEYWLGHLAQGVKPGTRVKRGQYIATISPDHAAPHVHIDRR